MTISTILTDIEGTTTSISFVHDVLFPYSSEKMAQFVTEQSTEPNVAAILDEVRKEAEIEAQDLEAVVKVLLQWIAEDKKITPLKALQGLIWEAGYLSGELKGHLYPDANQYLNTWKEQGIALYVYSSGSVKAQKLLYGYSEFGDLTPLFSGYFDTKIGNKKEQPSYEAIANEIGRPPQEILFLSDVEAELEPAKAAGMKVILLVREEELPADSPFKTARDFVDVDEFLKGL